MERHEAWAASSANMREAIEQAVRSLGGQVREVAPGSLVAEFGSKIGFRLLGGYIGNGRRRFPMRLTLLIQPRTGDASRLTATVVSNEGWYLVRLPATSRLFRDRSDEILRGLRAATEP
jgi:hypothetical protein